jgi:hypothetical protein
MYSLLTNLELSAIMLFVLFSFITANKVAKLVFNQTEKQLYRKTRKLLFWSVSLSLLAVAVAAADLMLAAAFSPLLWLDRLLIRTPLAVIPVLLIWLGSYPRLRKLSQRTNGQTDAPPDVARRRQASDPAFIVPYQLAALSSLALFYFAFVPPVPFRWLAVTVPAALLLFIASLLWMLQTHRNQLAAKAPLLYRPWRRRLKHMGVLLTAAAVLSIPFITAMEGSRLPDNLSMITGKGNSFGGLISKNGSGEILSQTAATTLDPLNYGTIAEPAPFNLSSHYDREFKMILDKRFVFYNGSFAAYDTINGEVFPNTPMFVVKKGELVKTTIVNRSSVDHPMHLHGHLMLVLSRNNEPVSGSLWWSDTLDVAPGETYVVAFVADNPGIWMDHCHNLVHAAAGMTMHLMYEGVSSPFEIGSATLNHPE